MTQPAPEEQDVQVAGGIPPDRIIRQLAEALCEAISESSLEYLEKEPEDAYIDLANRLVLRLAERRITIVAVFQHLFGQAALRVFKNFTGCLTKRPETAISIRRDESADGVALKFGVVAVGPNGSVRAFCRGEDAYDACAQLAQIMAYNEGSI